MTDHEREIKRQRDAALSLLVTYDALLHFERHGRSRPLSEVAKLRELFEAALVDNDDSRCWHGTPHKPCYSCVHDALARAKVSENK